ALRDQRHRTMPQRLRKPAAEGRSTSLDVNKPHAVGTTDAHAAFCKGANTSRALPARSMAAFPKAGGKNNRSANSVRVSLIQNVAGSVGRCRDHDTVDRLWKISDRWDALVAENLVVT